VLARADDDDRQADDERIGQKARHRNGNNQYRYACRARASSARRAAGEALHNSAATLAVVVFEFLAASRFAHLSRAAQQDVLHFEKFLEPVLRALAAETRLLERRRTAPPRWR